MCLDEPDTALYACRATQSGATEITVHMLHNWQSNHLFYVDQHQDFYFLFLNLILIIA